MANIKISELSSFNQVDAQELNQVVGGCYHKCYKSCYKPEKPKKDDKKPMKPSKPYGKVSIEDSFNAITQTNISNILQFGYGNVAVNSQSNYASI